MSRSRLFSAHYQEEGIVNKLSKILCENTKSYDEVLIFNIGTDRCIGDCLSPLVGTMLKEKKGFSITTYGTIKEPIHAMNLERRLNEVKVKHPNAFIIAIDACLGEKEKIGKIEVRNYPICPGKGVGKSLPSVGDISIVGVIDDSDGSNLFINRSIRLDFIYDMAKVISESLIKFEKKYIKNRKNNREIAVGE